MGYNGALSTSHRPMNNGSPHQMAPQMSGKQTQLRVSSVVSHWRKERLTGFSGIIKAVK